MLNGKPPLLPWEKRGPFLQFLVAGGLVGGAAALHQPGVQPAAVAVPGDPLPAAHLPEAAFAVQPVAGLVVLQDGGLQRPVAGLLGGGAQGAQQVAAVAPAPVALAPMSYCPVRCA